MAFVELSLSEIPGGHFLSNLETFHIQAITEASRAMVNIQEDKIQITGRDKSVPKVEKALRRIAKDLASGAPITERLIDTALRYATHDPEEFKKRNLAGEPATAVGTRARANIHPRSDGQALYLQALDVYDLVICQGPAGSGKTLLAVAKGLAMLERRQVNKIVITRPAVEAGEKLGFLPGDLKEKVDPYFRPLWDAIAAIAGPTTLAKMLKEEVIEVAPLAFMRGRTLSHAYCILDEAQNATSEQMKMFLTRLGEGAKMVVAGDPDQVDLPKGISSGLKGAVSVLKAVRGVEIITLDARDVVRHPLVAEIVQAYSAVRQDDLVSNG